MVSKRLQYKGLSKMKEQIKLTIKKIIIITIMLLPFSLLLLDYLLYSSKIYDRCYNLTRYYPLETLKNCI